MLGAERASARSVTSIRLRSIALLGSVLIVWFLGLMGFGFSGASRRLSSWPSLAGVRFWSRLIRNERWSHAQRRPSAQRSAVASTCDLRGGLKSPLRLALFSPAGRRRCAIAHLLPVAHIGMPFILWFEMPNVQDERDGYLARSVRQHDP